MSEQQPYQPARGNWPQTLAILSLLALAGIALAIYQYHQHSRVMLSAGNELAERLHQQLQEQLLAAYQAPRQALHLLQHDELLRTRSLEQRRPHLHKLLSVLQHNPQLGSIYIGWPDGDYLMLRPLHSLTLRERFDAPTGANWQLWHIGHITGERIVTHEFYDDLLRPLSSSTVDDEGFEPRQRPWYQMARQAGGEVITNPYVFFSTSEFGTTIALPVGELAVIAADVTLRQLSKTLEESRFTPSSELLLYSGDGTVVAYQDVQRVVGISQSGQQRLRRIDELGSTLLASLESMGSQQLQQERQTELQLEGRQWLLLQKPLKSERLPDTWLALMLPQNELLEDAYRIRFESVMVTLLITFLLLPLAWAISRMRGG